MNMLMLAALPATARPAFASATAEDPDLTRAGLTAVDAERIGEALAAARTDGTRRLYDVVWGQWQRWCTQRGVTAVPADPLTVCAYLTERAEAGRATGTLDMACTVIRHVHRTTGAVDPIASEAVRQVRRGLRRTYGAAPRRLARPLSVEEIRQIVGGIDRDHPARRPRRRDHPARLRLRHAPRRARRPRPRRHRDTSPPGSCCTSGNRRWTKEAHGQTRRRRPRPARRSPTPSRPSTPGGTSAAKLPARCSPGSGGARISAERLSGHVPARMLRARAEAAGLDGTRITAHSLRAGHATAAALAGVPLNRIAAQTRHKDLGVLVNRYIRPLEALATTSSKDIGL